MNTHHDQPSERRKTSRYPCLENQIQFEWQGPLQIQKSSGSLLNVNAGGALCTSELMPRLGDRVFVRLKLPARTDWIEVRVIRQVNQNEVAIVFDTACPYDLVLGATLGINLDDSLFGSSDGITRSTSGD